MGCPVIFLQKRVGLNNQEFRIYKFRTMRHKSEKYITDADRLTLLGKILRKTSIDEFPQLLNILIGDMSFIGPRPLLKKYLPFFTKREMLRFQLRPGMSGLAQINGRSYLTWDQQFELDAVYTEKCSFLLDLKIFFMTIPKVLGSANMMVTGRIDPDSFDIHRKKQIKLGTISLDDLNNIFTVKGIE